MKDALHAECERLGLLAEGQRVEVVLLDGSRLRLRIESWDTDGLHGTDLRARGRKVHPRWASLTRVEQLD